MNTARIVSLPVALSTSLILSTCGGDSIGPGDTPSNTGSLSVTVTTSGADPGDGYTVEVFGTAEQHHESKRVGLNGSVLFSNLTPGQYRIQLYGRESNCAVAGDNPRTVSIAPNQTTSSTFDVTCVAVIASLEVWTNSCGSQIDQDGYTVSIDGVVRGTIGANAADTFSVEGLGEHEVLLGDVADGCVVCQGNAHVVEVTRADGEPTVSTRFYTYCNPDLIGKIAFARGRTVCGGGVCAPISDIYLLSLDHPCPTRVISTNLVHYDPALSPDGERIAFTQGLVYASLRLIVMNADGSDVVRVEQPNVSDPSWAPDGSRLAFAKSSTQGDITDSDIYLVDADGTGLVNLTGHLGTFDTGPAWSPDGERIVFASAGDLFLIDVDGTHATRLTEDPEAHGDPAWSPDGAQIAFTCDRGGSNEICVVNADGTGLLQLTYDAAGSRDPVWSPDGTQIAFRRHYTTPLPYETFHSAVFLMNADGSDARRMIHSASEPTWSWARLPQGVDGKGET